nr:heat-shock protein Hsp20 [Bacillota bacterium]
MPLIPQDPMRPFDAIRREMERLLDPSNWNFFQSQWLQTDVYETDDEVVVECAIPGVTKKENIRLDL